MLDAVPCAWKASVNKWVKNPYPEELIFQKACGASIFIFFLVL